MTIFIKILKFFKATGFIVTLFLISYLFTGTIYYSRNHIKDELNLVEIIEDKNIKIIDQKDIGYIVLDIEAKGNVSDEYLVAYALSYKDKYSKEIHLYVVDEEIVINTGKLEIYVKEKKSCFHRK